MAGDNFREPISVTIANGASISGAANVVNTSVVALVTPAAWTAAGIGFHASYDNGTTYVQVAIPDYTASPPFGLDEYEILAADVPTAEAYYIAIPPELLLGASHVKVRSQTAGTPVNQNAERTVRLVVRDIKA